MRVELMVNSFELVFGLTLDLCVSGVQCVCVCVCTLYIENTMLIIVRARVCIIIYRKICRAAYFTGWNERRKKQKLFGYEHVYGHGKWDRDESKERAWCSPLHIERDTTAHAHENQRQANIKANEIKFPFFTARVCWFAFSPFIVQFCLCASEWANVCKRICIDVNMCEYIDLAVYMWKITHTSELTSAARFAAKPRALPRQRPGKIFQPTARWLCFHFQTIDVAIIAMLLPPLPLLPRVYCFFVSFVWNVRQNTFRFPKTLSPAK